MQQVRKFGMKPEVFEIASGSEPCKFLGSEPEPRNEILESSNSFFTIQDMGICLKCAKENYMDWRLKMVRFEPKVLVVIDRFIFATFRRWFSGGSRHFAQPEVRTETPFPPFH